MKPILGEPSCDPMPSSRAIQSADAMLARSARGICPFCKTRMTDETCPCWTKENE